MSELAIELTGSTTPPDCNHGEWSLQEEEIFLRALKDFGVGNSKGIATVLTTRSLLQIETHCQNYLLRNEAIPSGDGQEIDTMESLDSDGAKTIRNDNEDRNHSVLAESNADHSGTKKGCVTESDHISQSTEFNRADIVSVSQQPTFAIDGASTVIRLGATSMAFPIGSMVVNPRDEDIVATRSKRWADHIGTVFYRNLIVHSIQKLVEGSEVSQSQLADRILRILTKDRRGLFLLEKDDGTLVVMNASAARNKVTLALTRGRKAEHRRKEQELGLVHKKIKPAKEGKVLNMTSSAVTKNVNAPIEKLISADRVKVGSLEYHSKGGASVYLAKEGSIAVPEYTLSLISFMCNQTDPQAALTALDNPLLKNEDDGQREIRLQLRHRYIASLSVGISTQTFSQRLMQIWGGSVIQVNQIDKLPQELVPGRTGHKF